MKTSPNETCFKNLEGKLERKSLKRTISVSGRLELLQMVSEPDTGRCANENARPRKGWIVRSHIDWREERVSTRMLGLEGG